MAKHFNIILTFTTLFLTAHLQAMDAGLIFPPSSRGEDQQVPTTSWPVVLGSQDSECGCYSPREGDGLNRTMTLSLENAILRYLRGDRNILNSFLWQYPRFLNDPEVQEILRAHWAQQRSEEPDGNPVLDGELEQSPNLYYAVAVGNNIRVAELLRNQSIDVDTRVEGMTPLMMAVAQENIAAIYLLISNGADVLARDSRGYRPLDFAIANYRRQGLRFSLAALLRRVPRLYGDPRVQSIIREIRGQQRSSQ